MKCRIPFEVGDLRFGCGQCLPCRISRRRIWVTRLMLEYIVSQIGCFVTLTYDDEHLPVGANLNGKDLQAFNKKLRKRVGKFRFFACGEYGENLGRPHYHILIFGKFIGSKIIKDVWGKGRVHVGELNKYTIQYTAGYVLKKMTQSSDKFLRGKKPEFSRMSRRPGIGAGAVSELARVNSKTIFKFEQEIRGDVKNEINFGKEKMPLGRYLKSKIRKEIGLDNDDNVKKRLDCIRADTRAQKRADQEAAAKRGISEQVVRIEREMQSYIKLEKRSKIYNRRNKIE